MKCFSLFIIILFACSCSTSINDYKNEKPVLKLDNFFSGKLIAHGFFKDRNNKVTKRFIVNMNASWKDNIGTLDEDFLYSDGSKSKRVWTLTKVNETEYIGEAPDVIGKAKGVISGNTLLWNYVLKLEVDKKIYEVTFEDWMYLIDDSNLMNQSYMSKFNINLGQVVLNIQKIK
ncbi:MAG: DUF3833 domain-containing protein [Bacteriovorax sp.]|nr:DUF3833 domain-containing protein [Bacteriovorax sp.]